MSAPLPDALRLRFRKLVEERLSGRAAALRLTCRQQQGPDGRSRSGERAGPVPLLQVAQRQVEARSASRLLLRDHRAKPGTSRCRNCRLPCRAAGDVPGRHQAATGMRAHAARVHHVGGQAERALKQDPFAGNMFVFRGRRSDLIKIIWWDGQGACLSSKRLEKGRFVWPSAKESKITLSPAQLAMLLEGIDWRVLRRS